MSLDQCIHNLNQIDKELADLEKKLAEELKNEANKTRKINDISNSITKNTSASSYSSKIKQIQ